MPTETTHPLLKLSPVLAGCVLLAGSVAAAQGLDRIYRCGNEYTNNPSQSQLKGCVALQGGNVTVVQGGRPPAKTSPTKSGGVGAAPESTQSRVDPGQQKSRDSDARAILSAELKRAESQLADAQLAYGSGQPALRPGETPGTAAHAQRVAELKANVARAEADVVGIRRELQRLGVDVPASAGPVVGSANPAVVAR
ncbi:MAG: hypothetical protein Q8S32_08210 [Burkholderiaceae bacterium]|nr:hypothetical protein [Burkholderiaceae bacterium]